MPDTNFPNGVDVGSLKIGGTEVSADADDINKLDGSGATVASGTPVANQGDLATDADGTAIAAAVDGLRDALVAFGIMAEAE